LEVLADGVLQSPLGDETSPAAQEVERTFEFGAADNLPRDTNRGPNHHTVRGAVAEHSAKVIAKIALRSASTNPTTPRLPRKAE